MDNPDERIGQNIASFTHFSIHLMTSLLKDFLNITMSSMRLFAMSPLLFYILAAVSLIYTFVSLGLFAGPEQSESGLLIRVFYADLCCRVSFRCSRGPVAGPLIRIQRRVLAVEANLRYCLVRIRESGESVAFFVAINTNMSAARKCWTMRSGRNTRNMLSKSSSAYLSMWSNMLSSSSLSW